MSPAEEARAGASFGFWEFPQRRGTLFWGGPYNKDPTIILKVLH